MSIKRLDSQSVSRICVNQVVVDLPMCIKELVENSLDAGAKKIDVVFYEHGSAGVRVTDSGSGIDVENFDAFTPALKGATSKIGDFDDISKILTYGFRGEALNAISRLSEMKITTRTAKDVNGWELSFDNDFKLVAQKDVTKANLFRNLPVRYQEYKNNYKQQFTNAVSLLENYAIIFTNVRLTVVNSTADKPWDVILSNNGPNPEVKDNILAIFGKKVLDTLGEVKYDDKYLKMEGFATKAITSGSMKSPYKKDMLYFFVNKRPVTLSKKFIMLLNTSYKQHNPNAKYFIVLNLTLPPDEYDINISPDKKEIVFKKPNSIYNAFKSFFDKFLESERTYFKTLEETHQKKNNYRKSTNKDNTDLKEESFFKTSEQPVLSDSSTKKRKNEEDNSAIADSLKKVKLTQEETFTTMTQPANNTRKSVQQSTELSQRYTIAKSESKKSEEESKPMNDVYLKFKSTQQTQNPRLSTQKSLSNKFDEFEVSNKKNYRSFEEEKKSDEEGEMEEEKGRVFQASQDSKPTYKVTEIKFPMFNIPKIELKPETKEQPSFKIERIILPAPIAKTNNVDDEDDEDGGDDISEENSNHSHCHSHKSEGDNDKGSEPPKDFLSSITTIKLSDFATNNSTKHEDSHSLSDRSSIKQSILPESKVSNKDSNDKDTRDTNDSLENRSEDIANYQSDTFLDSMIQNMSKSFQKAQFANLFLIGQFNLGFIVCIFPVTNEIYVIDQHAAAEKFNFEKLMREQKVTPQYLVCPLSLHLSQTHRLLLKENLDIAEKNGFKVQVSKDSNDYQTLKLLSLPMIKNVTFKEDDLVELLNLIEANPYEKDEARIPKIKNLFATKACRSAVKIGDALDFPEMKKVVNNLATMKSPWNCPHGRPTLITLGDLKRRVSDISKPRPKRPFNLKNL